jgi:hypothetical protein
MSDLGYYKPEPFSDKEKFQSARIEALEAEIVRLNNQILDAKISTSKIKFSNEIFIDINDPIFSKKLSEIEVNYGK